MERSSIKLVLFLLAFSLTSCQTIVEELVVPMAEYDMQKGVSNARPGSKQRKETKKEREEREQLERDGKCTVCKGIGKSADGKYVCTACNGTGKTTEKNQ
jgi:RecJ-like exonuclease